MAGVAEQAEDNVSLLVWRANDMDRVIAGQNAFITALSQRVGYLEDTLQDIDRRLVRAGQRPPMPGPPPVVHGLTGDDSDDEIEFLGGPFTRGVVVQEETPENLLREVEDDEIPNQELLEQLRSTPIRDEDNQEASRAADLLVRAGMALPEYEDAPPYEE